MGSPDSQADCTTGYEVDGLWMEGIILFDPAHADEISASIEEYLQTR